jgi:hypothetical protein
MPAYDPHHRFGRRDYVTLDTPDGDDKETPMLSKEAYVRRLGQCLDAADELDFLYTLSQEELSLLWSKVAGTTLRVGRMLSSRSA